MAWWWWMIWILLEVSYENVWKSARKLLLLLLLLHASFTGSGVGARGLMLFTGLREHYWRDKYRLLDAEASSHQLDTKARGIILTAFLLVGKIYVLTWLARIELVYIIAKKTVHKWRSAFILHFSFPQLFEFNKYASFGNYSIM